MILTSRLELHPFTPELASAIADGRSNGQLWAPGFPREDDSDAARMFLQAPSDEFGSFEIRNGATKEAIGTIGFFGPPDEEGAVMVGYGLVEQARGFGYATEALHALVTYAMTRPEVSAMVADAELDNIASHRVLEKCGFSLTGQTESSALYRLSREEVRKVAMDWEQIVVDSRDPEALGRWWLEALGWVVVEDSPHEFEIRPTPDRTPGLLFVPVPEAKTVKNRLHIDLRPDDQAAEVERLLALGASKVDKVQDEQNWVTLTDPEGNEFCVLSSRRG